MTITLRRTVTVAAAASLAGLLAACGGLEPSDGTPADPGQDASAEAGETGTEADETAATADESTDEEETADEAPSDERNARGNLPKEVGETAGISDDAVGENVAEFTLTEIADPLECNGEFPDGPANGRFVGLHFEVDVFDTWNEESWGDLSMTSFEFKAYTADGTVVNDPSGNALFCMDEASSLPPAIGAGTSANGWIVLDLPEEAASVAFEPSVLLGAGWEWALEGAK